MNLPYDCIFNSLPDWIKILTLIEFYLILLIVNIIPLKIYLNIISKKYV